MVAALGCLPDLVGRSAECDYPPEVRSLPVVMRAKTLDSDSPSGEIDARVKEARGREESLYSLDLELLRRLRPELLLTQDLCGVCSVTEAEVAQGCAAAGVEPRILSMTPRRLGHVIDSVREIGGALGVEARGAELARQWSSAWNSPSRARPNALRVAVLEWLDPPILAGLWVPEMIARAGARSWNGPEAGEPGRPCRWEELDANPPDAVVLSPCSFTVERTQRELGTERLKRAMARQRERGWWVADEAHFSRPGPRLGAGIELLRSIVETGEGRSSLPVARLAPAHPRSGS